MLLGEEEGRMQGLDACQSVQAQNASTAESIHILAHEYGDYIQHAYAMMRKGIR